MEGWIKLHRLTLDNSLLANDNAAYIVFTKLLMCVNRKTGVYVTGRFKLSDLCNLKPTTAWKALKRLEKAEMVTLVSDNKKTTIYICNWGKYQSGGDTASDNKVTTKGQLGVTKQEVEVEVEKEAKFKTNFKQPSLKKRSGHILAQVREICDMFREARGGEYYNTLNITPTVGLIQSHGIDRVREVSVAALALKPKQFQVEINKPVDLADHWGKVVELIENPVPVDSKDGWT